MYKWLLICLATMPSIVSGVATVDPTKPASYSGVGAENGSNDAEGVAVVVEVKLQLNAILFSSDRKIVMINGELKKEGEMVGLYKVTQILENKVYLTKGSEVRVLYFREPFLKSVGKEETR